jgi:hypothetical protein
MAGDFDGKPDNGPGLSNRTITNIRNMSASNSSLDFILIKGK